MPKNEIVSTENVATGDGSARPGVSYAYGAKAAYEALLRAVASDNGVNVDLADITDVSLANGKVTVQYVDQEKATQFDPSPVGTITSSVKS